MELPDLKELAWWPRNGRTEHLRQSASQLRFQLTDVLLFTSKTNTTTPSPTFAKAGRPEAEEKFPPSCAINYT